MATHSSVAAWRSPWTGGPGGLQSTGSKRVGHDCSDLALTHPSQFCILLSSLQIVLKEHYLSRSCLLTFFPLGLQSRLLYFKSTGKTSLPPPRLTALPYLASVLARAALLPPPAVQISVLLLPGPLGGPHHPPLHLLETPRASPSPGVPPAHLRLNAQKPTYRRPNTHRSLPNGSAK